jgi:hypothetical protein
MNGLWPSKCPDPPVASLPPVLVDAKTRREVMVMIWGRWFSRTAACTEVTKGREQASAPLAP